MASLELRTNVLAAYVAGGRAAEVPAVCEAMKISAADSFEVAFNMACALLAAGDVPRARTELERAQRLGACAAAAARPPASVLRMLNPLPRHRACCVCQCAMHVAADI